MFQLSLNKPTSKMMALLILFSTLTMPTLSYANDDALSIENIKKQLINDPDFISSISKKVAQDPAIKEDSQQNNEDKIRTIIKSYLVENPEVMIEVQTALEEKQTQSIKSFQQQYISSHNDEIFNSKNDAVFGNPNGDITIVEFYDYNCGYCKRSFPDMMNLLKANPNIRFVMKEFPVLGEDSAKTHIVAQSFQKLMPEKYMDFHKKLMLSNGRANEEKAIDIALSLGANEKKLRALMNDKNTIDSLRKNAQIAYDLGINGTPSYIIGDEVLAGAVGEDTLLKAAQKLKK